LAQSGVGKLTPGLRLPVSLGYSNCRASGKRCKESIMRRRINNIRIIGIVTVLVVAGTVLCSATAQKMPVPRPQDSLAMGEDQVRQLMLLMHTDKKGMVSHQEYTRFMEAEFERLDKEKKGELDAKKLAQSNLTASHYVGK
jgi:hypothetical protein